MKFGQNYSCFEIVFLHVLYLVSIVSVGKNPHHRKKHYSVMRLVFLFFSLLFLIVFGMISVLGLASFPHILFSHFLCPLDHFPL